MSSPAAESVGRTNPMRPLGGISGSELESSLAASPAPPSASSPATPAASGSGGVPSTSAAAKEELPLFTPTASLARAPETPGARARIRSPDTQSQPGGDLVPRSSGSASSGPMAEAFYPGPPGSLGLLTRGGEPVNVAELTGERLDDLIARALARSTPSMHPHPRPGFGRSLGARHPVPPPRPGSAPRAVLGLGVPLAPGGVGRGDPGRVASDGAAASAESPTTPDGGGRDHHFSDGQADTAAHEAVLSASPSPRMFDTALSLDDDRGWVVAPGGAGWDTGPGSDTWRPDSAEGPSVGIGPQTRPEDLAHLPLPGGPIQPTPPFPSSSSSSSSDDENDNNGGGTTGGEGLFATLSKPPLAQAAMASDPRLSSTDSEDDDDVDPGRAGEGGDDNPAGLGGREGAADAGRAVAGARPEPGSRLTLDDPFADQLSTSTAHTASDADLTAQQAAAGPSQAAAAAAARQADDDRCWFHYSRPRIQGALLADGPRNFAYWRALVAVRSKLRRGPVLDLGAGYGPLSLMAASLGAPRVYAVEASLGAHEALLTALRRTPRLATVVVPIHAPLEHLAPPVPASPSVISTGESSFRSSSPTSASVPSPRPGSGAKGRTSGGSGTVSDRRWLPLARIERMVQVLVADWIGALLYDEGMIRSFLRARDHFCVPGALIIPEQAQLITCPVTVPRLFQDVEALWGAALPRYHDPAEHTQSARDPVSMSDSSVRYGLDTAHMDHLEADPRAGTLGSGQLHRHGPAPFGVGPSHSTPAGPAPARRPQAIRHHHACQQPHGRRPYQQHAWVRRW